MEEKVVVEWVRGTLRREVGVKFLRAVVKSVFVRVSWWLF